MYAIKRLIAVCLALLVLVPVATATEEQSPFETSDWAYEDVLKAMDLNILYDPSGWVQDTR